MKSDSYPLTSSPETATFHFISRGPRGDIPKLIQFELLSAEPLPLYNLAFGDGTTTLDDLAVSANGDTEKVLATVVMAVRLFLVDYPHALVYAAGSTPARTRLYRMGLTRYLTTFEAEIKLFGIIDGAPEPFEPNRPYEAFIAQRRPV